MRIKEWEPYKIKKKEYDEQKEMKKFESKGATNGVTVSLRQISIGILLFLTIIGSIIAHEDRYVKASELEKHAVQNAQEIKEIKDAQIRAEKETKIRQQAILDKLDELNK